MTSRSKPTWGRSHASICHWNLQFRFYTKDQCQRFIDLLLKEEIDYHFEFRLVQGDSITPPEYWIEIHDQPWANNLKRVAEILHEVDYDAS